MTPAPEAKERHARYPPLEDYAIIGDGRTAALVSKDGSIDWLCLPRFDSPSVFAGILDADRGGRFRVGPAQDARVERRYLEGSNVLETTFHCEGGVVRLLDLMSITDPGDPVHLVPDHEVLRVVECLEGEVEIEAVCAPRPNYARTKARAQDRGRAGIFFDCCGQVLVLTGEMPFELREDRQTARASCRLRKGERRRISLGYADGEPAVLVPLGEHADERLDLSLRWWREWCEQCTYQGPYREQVLRSALVLKLLVYSPSGAIVAAPTTSLPEAVGGERNWDYRYCWIRDASDSLGVLKDLGFRDEEDKFFTWLLNATARTHPRLQVMYDLHGHTRLTESELDSFEGYRRSQPVRIGNGAHDQLQLDIYGTLVAAAHEFACHQGGLDWFEARILRGLGEVVCDLWTRPDNGIWEKRKGREHNTYSKLMCWVALDRLLHLNELGYLKVPAERFRRERKMIRERIRSEAWDEKRGTYVDAFGGRGLDASLLLIGHYGFEEPTSERFRGTYEAVQRELGVGPFLYRYLNEGDAFESQEGTFWLCSFWAVESLVLQGRREEGRERFEALLERANDVGLYAEQYDPMEEEMLGNLPQAFSHLGLVNAALCFEGERRARAGKGPEEIAGEGENR